MLKILNRYTGRESLAPPVPRCVRFWRIFAPPASCDMSRRCNFATCPRPPNCPPYFCPGAPRAPAVSRGVVLGVPRHALPRPCPRRFDKLRPRYFAPCPRRGVMLAPVAVMRPAFNRSIKTAAPFPARCFILSPNRRSTGGVWPLTGGTNLLGWQPTGGQPAAYRRSTGGDPPNYVVANHYTFDRIDTYTTNHLSKNCEEFLWHM